MLTLTVSQLNRYVKAVLEEDTKLSDLYIRGEISNFTHHSRSGHFYFSLKDEKSAVRAVMFEGYSSAVPFKPKNGMMVILRANLGVYERDGAYQLYVTDMQPDGTGALALAFEQLKARLSAEGLFDERHKKPLPAFPLRIGVVTSETGAAFQDIVTVLTRRYPLAALVLSPALVQGAEAEKSLIKALDKLNGKCDVVIIGRGGGSAEDLSCFNGEALARAVFMAHTPVISAVGHETDFTICDFVADVRAPTPSAAAELASPSADALSFELARTRDNLKRRAAAMLDACSLTLDRSSSHPALLSPMILLEKKYKKLDFLSERLYNNKNAFLKRLETALISRSALLDSLSPLRVLDRGYAAVFRDGDSKRPVRSVAELSEGESIEILMRGGRARAHVIETTEVENPWPSKKI